MASPQPNLICKACGYANESQRVYCHNCGVKLDRDILNAQQQRLNEPSPERQREVQKLMSPERGSFAKGFKKLCKTVALAALVGALIAAALPPEGVSEDPKAEETVEAPMIDSILETLAVSPPGKRAVLSEAEVNAYLKRERFKKLPPLITDSITLRALAHFEEGVGHLTLRATVAGYPLYITLSGNLSGDKAAGLVANCTGGSIGRLQIPDSLACYAGWALPTVLDSMKREQELLGQIGFIEFRKEKIILGSRGTSATSAPAPAPIPPAPSGAAARPVVH